MNKKELMFFMYLDIFAIIFVSFYVGTIISYFKLQYYVFITLLIAILITFIFEFMR